MVEQKALEAVVHKNGSSPITHTLYPTVSVKTGDQYFRYDTAFNVEQKNLATNHYPYYYYFICRTSHTGVSGDPIAVVITVNSVNSTTWSWYIRLYMNGVLKFTSSTVNEVLGDIKFLSITGRYYWRQTDVNVDTWDLECQIVCWDDPYGFVAETGFPTSNYTVNFTTNHEATSTHLMRIDVAEYHQVWSTGEYFLAYFGPHWFSRNALTFGTPTSSFLDRTASTDLGAATAYEYTNYTWKQIYQRDYKLEIDTLKADLATANSAVLTVDTKVDTVNTNTSATKDAVLHASYGLYTIVNSYLNSGTIGLGAIQSIVAALYDLFVTRTPTAVNAFVNTISELVMLLLEGKAGMDDSWLKRILQLVSNFLSSIEVTTY